MQLPLQCSAASTLGLQEQIFSQIRQLILDEQLKPGTRMPASRALASDLEVSRNTVVLAYDRLIAEGYLESRQPVGTFVSSKFVHNEICSHTVEAMGSVGGPAGPHTLSPKRRAPMYFRGKAQVIVSPHRSPVPYDFWVGRPDSRLFPIKDWMQIMRRKLRDMQKGNSSYTEPAGLPVLREAIAGHVGVTRGIRTDASQIIVVNGTQEALTILSQLFIRPGTEVVIENPCYQGAANVFESHGARLHSIAVDSDGLIMDRLPSNASLVYLTPSHQYPTGAMLSPTRRSYLLEWCNATGSYILEDGYNSDFCYDSAPLPALKSQDRCGQVIYLGTFSKSLGAGLRAGYMILPDHLVAPATAAKGLLNICSGWAVQALLTEFLISGEYHRHLRRIRTVYTARRNRLIELLTSDVAGGQTTGTQSGMHITWSLPPGWPSAAELELRAREIGVGIYSLETGNAAVAGRAARAQYARTVMMGYAALNESEITEGVCRLAARFH